MKLIGASSSEAVAAQSWSHQFLGILRTPCPLSCALLIWALPTTFRGAVATLLVAGSLAQPSGGDAVFLSRRCAQSMALISSMEAFSTTLLHGVPPACAAKLSGGCPLPPTGPWGGQRFPRRPFGEGRRAPPLPRPWLHFPSHRLSRMGLVRIQGVPLAFRGEFGLASRRKPPLEGAVMPAACHGASAVWVPRPRHSPPSRSSCARWGRWHGADEQAVSGDLPPPLRTGARYLKDAPLGLLARCCTPVLVVIGNAEVPGMLAEHPRECL